MQGSVSELKIKSLVPASAPAPKGNPIGPKIKLFLSPDSRMQIMRAYRIKGTNADGGHGAAEPNRIPQDQDLHHRSTHIPVFCGEIPLNRGRTHIVGWLLRSALVPSGRGK